jgi:signal transduction histidine kinase
MADFSIAAVALLAGLLAGGLIGRSAGRRAAAPETLPPTALSRLSHDLRGALSPAMLMAERLEGHGDAGVRQAAEIISRALDRAATLCRDASAAAKKNGS